MIQKEKDCAMSVWLRPVIWLQYAWIRVEFRQELNRPKSRLLDLYAIEVCNSQHYNNHNKLLANRIAVSNGPAFLF